MKRHLHKGLFAAFIVVLAGGFAADVFGCSVPVFRYALERWERDEYRLIVATKGELPPEYQKWVEELRQQSYNEEGFCNLNVHVLDITDEANKRVLEAYPAVAKATKPTAFLLYPLGAYLQTVIHEEPFSEGTVKKLMSSAFVEDLTFEILRGTSAIWVLVDSGNKVEDDKAFNILSSKVEELAEQIELPAGVIETTGNITGGLTEEDVRANYDPANFLRSGIPLKIGFVVKRLTKEQAEPIFRAILMNVEEGLEKDYGDQPMAFPVFGRGRFLLPLVGEGINVENIEMASTYVCGICSCQVKSGNPGVDLLSHVDWYSYLEGSEVVHDRELPPLTGISDLTEPDADVPEEISEEPVVLEQPSILTRNMVVMLAVVLGVVVGASFVIVKKKQD